MPAALLVSLSDAGLLCGHVAVAVDNGALRQQSFSGER
jgi:hypothetical protein